MVVIAMLHQETYNKVVVCIVLCGKPYLQIYICSVQKVEVHIEVVT